jgi:hypothetical protein
MPHTLVNPPKEFRRRVDDQYKCECGEAFRTYELWEKHRAQERRNEKQSANSA